MGRQTELYLLQEDFEELWQWMQEKAPVTLVEHFSDSPVVEPCHPMNQSGQQLCIWNQSLLRELERKYFANSEHEKFRVDEFKLPVLTFSLCRLTVWNNKPALLNGRIYGIFELKDAGFEKWYNAIVRWIRKNFFKSPVKLSGYIGKHALEWFNNGGILLPCFLPPLTESWIRFTEEQHSDRS